MVSVSSCITLREDEWVLIAIPLILKAASVVENLVEEGDHVDWEIRRASASVVLPADRIRHVRFVVRRVDVSSVPACREEDLCTQATRTVEVWHLVCLRKARPAQTAV